MCGRYSLNATPVMLAAHFSAVCDESVLAFAPRFNVAPTQQMPIVRLGAAGAEVCLARWGLVPSWARSAALGHHLFNARAETLAFKPAFRDAFRHQRCLVPADAFYEWHAETPDAVQRQPYRISRADRALLAFAGLWAQWSAPDGTTLLSYTIITAPADASVRPIHERMPVIVRPEHYARWLGLKADPAYGLTLIEGLAPGSLRIDPVSTVLNQAAHDAADCAEPIRASARGSGL